MEEFLDNQLDFEYLYRYLDELEDLRFHDVKLIRDSAYNLLGCILVDIFSGNWFIHPS
jgi:hypothetical protein